MSGKSKIALIAAGIALATGAALLLLPGPKPADEAVRPAVAPPDTATAPAAAEPARAEATEAPTDIAPPEMMEAKSALEAEYAERRKDIPEEIAKPIDDDIGMIEGIAADLLAALANEPDNDSLKRMLVQTYRNEMKLLKKALHLSGEEDTDMAGLETESAETN